MISIRMSAAGLAAAAMLALAAGAQAHSYAYTTIDAPADPSLFGTVVTDINNAGQTSGYYVDLVFTGDPSNPFAEVFHAFEGSADGGVFTNIDQPGFGQNGSSGINNAGAIVGVSGNFGGSGAGFLRSPGGAFSTVDPASQGFPSLYSEAIGIDDAGVIYGYFATAVGPDGGPVRASSHGYIDSGGVFTQFDVPAGLGVGTQLIVANKSGVIAGGYVDLGGNDQGFIYTPGLGFSTPTFPDGAPSSEIGTINTAGDYVGSGIFDTPASPLGYIADGFLFSEGGFHVLAAPGAFSTEPLGLNDRGQITGLYIDPNGIHGFVATPAPEPAAWALLLAGVGLLGAALRRGRGTESRALGDTY